MVLALIAAFLFVGYAALMLYYENGWRKISNKTSETPEKASFSNIADKLLNSSCSSPFFSVVIPARNESEHIEDCLQGILNQSLPPNFFEVILVDDFSEDGTAAVAMDFVKKRFEITHDLPDFRIISLEHLLPAENRNKANKKAAIDSAVQQSNGTWIITTDADCVHPEHWLATLYYEIEVRKESNIDEQNHNVKPKTDSTETAIQFIAAPVKYRSKTGWASSLFVFQTLDFLSLQGVSAAAAAQRTHVLCNGANLGFRKSAFLAVDGYSGIDHLPTGDDMLLMEKMYQQFPSGVQYCLRPEAVVETYPTNTWRGFFQQRIRWASKADQYKNPKIFFVLLWVYLFNVSLLALTVWSIFSPSYWKLLGALLVCKTIVELYFLLPVARFFKQLNLLVWFPLAQPFHVLYTIAAGWLGKMGAYQWKGRTVEQEKKILPSSSKKRKKRFWKNPLSWFSVAIIGLTLFTAMVGPFFTADQTPNANRMVLEIGGKPPGYQQQFLILENGEYLPVSSFQKEGNQLKIQKRIDDNLSEELVIKNSPNIKPTTLTFYLGTDLYGRDILSRLVLGARISLSVGLVAVLISLILGVFLGMLSGFYRGKIDQLIQWVVNVVWSIPTLLLVFGITWILGKGFWQVFAAVGLSIWVNVARLVRGKVLSERELTYVEAARALGYGEFRIMFRHLLPNVMGPVIVLCAANFASAIVLEAGLSFLGVGVQAPQPSWGLMMREHYNFIITNQPFLAVVPGIAIVLLVLAFNLLGLAIKDSLDRRA